MKAFSKSEKKILLSLLSILIILCSLAFFSHRNSSRSLASAEEVEHAREIKYSIEQVLSISIDLETRARGYVITGEDRYLDPTNKAVASIFEHIDKLKVMSSGNPAHLDRLAELEKLVDQKVTNITRIIEARRNKGSNEAIAYFSASDDKALLDRIRSITMMMLDEEKVLLEKKKAENKADIRNFNITFDLLLVKIAITIFAVFFLLKYYFKQRRKSDELLRESKELLQNIIDNTTSVIFIKDIHGRYLMVNDQYEKLFKVNKEAMKGKTDHDLFPKEIADAVTKADLEVIRNKTLMEFEEDVPSNNEMHHYISIKFPLFNDEHAVYAVCGMATDITDRKQTARELKERSDAIMDLFNNAPSGYHSLDRNGVIIEMNDTELNWLGYSREEVVGKIFIRDLLEIESRTRFDYHFPKLQEKKITSISDLEMKMVRKNGSVISVIINVSGIYNSDGELLRTRSSVFDITFRKQVESIISQN